MVHFDIRPAAAVDLCVLCTEILKLYTPLWTRRNIITFISSVNIKIDSNAAFTQQHHDVRRQRKTAIRLAHKKTTKHIDIKPPYQSLPDVGCRLDLG